MFDRTYSALILDLDARGLLDGTLVLCLSEHGRTPRLSKAKGGGRDHWSRAYRQVFAGGGMGRGNLVGRTDAIAGDAQIAPCHRRTCWRRRSICWGVNPHTTVSDRLGRPVAGGGAVRREMLK